MDGRGEDWILEGDGGEGSCAVSWDRDRGEWDGVSGDWDLGGWNGGSVDCVSIDYSLLET